MFIITEILADITYILDLVGVVIIAAGALCSLAKYFWGLIGKGVPITIDDVRLELGRSIVLAVEFLLGSDIIRTIITPDYYSIGMLGGLVIIRTVLTYFLDLELKGLAYKR